MLVIAGGLLGAGWGALLARRQHGSAADMVHYAAGFGIAFGIVGLFATMALGWAGLG